MPENKRVRHDKITVLKDKIETNNQKIAELQGKIDALNEENNKFTEEIAAAEEAAKKAASEAEQKELLKMIKKSGKSMDEIKAFLEA